MTTTPPSEHDIHAYVDGHLDGHRRGEVERYLSRHPERAEEVHAWRQDAQQLRTLDLKKVPSVSETIDWAKIMLLLHTSVLDVDVVRDTLNVLLKFEADIEAANKQIAGLTHKARQDAGVPA